MNENESKIGYDMKNLITFCTNCGNPLDGDETFCPVCGKKLIYDRQKEEELNNENDKKTHPYGWPVNEENFHKLVGKPIIINKIKAKEFRWDIIQSVNFSKNGCVIHVTNGIMITTEDYIIYDPIGFIKENPYPIEEKNNTDPIVSVTFDNQMYDLKSKSYPIYPTYTITK